MCYKIHFYNFENYLGSLGICMTSKYSKHVGFFFFLQYFLITKKAPSLFRIIYGATDLNRYM